MITKTYRSQRPFRLAEVEYKMDMLRRCGYKGHAPPLWVSEKKTIFSLPADFICFLPGGKPDERARKKSWPHYASLAQMFHRDMPDLSIIVIGTDKDEVSEDLLALPNVQDWRGQLTLAQTAWVLKHAKLVIANDCGPMHIAYAVRAPLITLFGPTCEVKSGPLYNGRVLSTEISCRPCMFDLTVLDHCTQPECMRGIKAEAVFRECQAILQQEVAS